MKKIPLTKVAAGAAFLCLLACGDDSSSSGSDKGEKEEGSVETVEDLGKCLSAFEGDIYFVKEMKGSYVCESGKWNPIPGVGECTDSLAAAGTVRKETHKALDNYGESLVCADSAWRPATDVEVALKNACVESLDGEFRDDSTNKKKVKHYVCTGNLWREASEAELAAKALCTYKNYGSFATDSSDKENVKAYVCKDLLWLEASSIEQAAGKVCDAGNYGFFVADSADKALPLYVCDGEMFRMASEAESATKRLCDSTLRGDTLNFYICTEGDWEKDTTTSLGNCTDKNEGEIAKEENPHRLFGLHSTASDSSYVCDGSKKLWREATAGEAATGKLCTEKVDGDTLNWFVCHAAENDWIAVMTSGLGKCDADSLDSIRTEPNPNLKKGDSLFVCANNGGFAWEILKKSLLGICDLKMQDSVRAETNFNLKTFDTLFVCDTSAWVKASKYDLSNNGVPCTGNLNAQVLNGKLCLDGKWKKASSGEVEMGAACLESTENVVSVEKGKVCKSGEWVAASAAEIATGKVCTAAILNTATNGYACAKDGWREASAAEKATGKICTAAILNTATNGYACESAGWRAASEVEKVTGRICNAAIKDSIINGYACNVVKLSSQEELSLSQDSLLKACVQQQSDVIKFIYALAYTAGSLTLYHCYDSISSGFDYSWWKKATEHEISFNKQCDSRNQETFLKAADSAFVCQFDTEQKYYDWMGHGTKGSFSDARDNSSYKYVIIGSQVWMAENLNYAYLQPTYDLDSSSFCYKNKPDSCAKYGRLYQWSAAMDSAAKFSTAGKGCGYDAACSPSGTVRGVCPEGWHLPDTSEFAKLADAVGGEATAGTALKSTSGWASSGNGSDDFGFTALPAGYRSDYGTIFNYNGTRGYFWSSTFKESTEAYARYLFAKSKSFERSLLYMVSESASVRCLKDID